MTCSRIWLLRGVQYLSFFYFFMTGNFRLFYCWLLLLCKRDGSWETMFPLNPSSASKNSIAPDKRVYPENIFINENVCGWYSLEAPQ